MWLLPIKIVSVLPSVLDVLQGTWPAEKGPLAKGCPGQAGRTPGWDTLGTLVRASCGCWPETEFVGSDESADGPLGIPVDRTCATPVCLICQKQNKTKQNINAACVALKGQNQNMKIHNKIIFDFTLTFNFSRLKSTFLRQAIVFLHIQISFLRKAGIYLILRNIFLVNDKRKQLKIMEKKSNLQVSAPSQNRGS